jgi:hypothetical protein
MIKKMFAVFLAALLVFGLSGCSAIQEAVNVLRDAGAGTAQNSDAQNGDSDGDGREEHSGRVGQRFSTTFFTFRVDDIQTPDEWAGYLPGSSSRLVAVQITTTNTFGEAIDMYDTDYELWWGSRSDSDAYALVLDALDDSMAPAVYELADGETMTFHYVFEVPADITEFELAYVEFYSTDEGEDQYGDIYVIPFDL